METIFENDEIKVQIQKQEPSQNTQGGYTLFVTSKNGSRVFPGYGFSDPPNTAILFVKFEGSQESSAPGSGE